MAGSKIPTIYLAILVALMVVSVQRVLAIEHHVVGDDSGWDTSTDLSSWSSGRLFNVGDIIWFAYTAGHESVVELESIEDLSSCNLSSPIKMYTDGLNEVQLDGEGTRFFASGKFESCKKGLKIHVNVHPKVEDLSQNDGHLETNDEGGDSQAPESSSPTPTPKPKPKPKPKRPPPPPDAGPDDDDPPPPPTPKPHPPPPSCSTMLDGRFFSMVVALFLSYFLQF